jgi:hypothetical protein
MNISDPEAEKIVDKMGALPLAVRQVSSYITTTGMKPEKFLAHYNEPKGEVAFNALGHSSMTYSHGLNTVWKMAFDRLSPESLRLLSVICFFDPHDIPVSVLSSYFAGAHEDVGQHQIQ